MLNMLVLVWTPLFGREDIKLVLFEDVFVN